MMTPLPDDSDARIAALEKRCAQLELAARGAAVRSTGDIFALPGQFIAIEAPSSPTLKVTLPQQHLSLKNSRITFSLLNSNPVMFLTVNGKVNGRSSGVMNLPGTFDAICDGVTGWYISPLAGGPGATGATGTTGKTGPMGPPGDTGETGPEGPVGLQGFPGLPGANGPQGPPGDTGDTGPQGDPGPAGPSSPGTPGATGATGATGTQGPQGNPGPPGDTGDTGPQGDPGPVGPTGPGNLIKATRLTGSGTHTFDIRTKAYVVWMQGDQGGGGGSTSSAGQIAVGAAGGKGLTARCYCTTVPVSVTFNCGAGGTAGSNAGTDGGDGAGTVWDTVTAAGGTHGVGSANATLGSGSTLGWGISGPGGKGGQTFIGALPTGFSVLETIHGEDGEMGMSFAPTSGWGGGGNTSTSALASALGQGGMSQNATATGQGSSGDIGRIVVWEYS